MPLIENYLSLTPSQPGRRVGLSRGKFPRVLQSIDSPTTNIRADMRIRTEKEDINRPPDSSDSEDLERGSIPPQVFEPVSHEPPTQTSKTKPKKSGKQKRTVNGNKSSKVSRQSTRTEIASTQDSDLESPKRKSQDDLPKIGKGMEDEFGRPIVKKAKVGYGSSSQPRGSQPTSTYGSSSQKLKREAVINRYDDLLEDPSTPERKNGKFNVAADLESPNSTPGSRRGIKKQDTPLALKEKESPMKRFKTPGTLDETDELSGPHYDISSPMSARKSRKKKEFQEDMQSTQYPAFKMPDISFGEYEEDELAGTAPAAIYADGIETSSADALRNDILSPPRGARCPMCDKPVDPEDLREFGDMNTRRQEKFCLAHQKKTAKQDWEAKGYPDIDWENLEPRLSKHYSFIKQVINGGDSYYRDVLEEKVNAGKERSLRQLTSNFTPGYYGTRGLRFISENLMHEFTGLIKRKAVKDRMISSRGPTAFVQSVLVPEIAVLLIMEDMSVEAEQAREILKESVALGELVQDEVREIVQRRVEDSEDEDEDGFDD